MDLFSNPITDKYTDLHAEPLVCKGCNDTFALTLHMCNATDGERYCGSCFYYRYGLAEYQFALTKMNFVQEELWAKPLAEIDPKIRKMLNFVDKKYGEPFETSFCSQCDKNVKIYWELDTCEKNPDGLIPEPTPHGNVIDGCATCDDDYCSPEYEQVDSDFVNEEYIKTHEVHARCGECSQFMESMN